MPRPVQQAPHVLGRPFEDGLNPAIVAIAHPPGHTALPGHPLAGSAEVDALDLTGYEVVIRETTDSDWTSAIPVGNVTSVTLNISKDNVQFGLRAVDHKENRSPVAFPQAVA